MATSLVQLRSADDCNRVWLVHHGKRIAFIRTEVLEQLARVEHFGPRELIPAERID